MTKRLLAAAALLLALGGFAWFALREAPTEPSARAAAEDASVIAAATERASRGPAPKRAARPATADASATATIDDAPPPVDLDKADRDLDLHGIVVDAAGKGVAGARLATVTYPWRKSTLLNIHDHDAEIAGPATRSARDGTFAIRLARGANVALRVSADGFASIEMPSVLAGERVRIVLGPGVRLIVSLTDASGAPVGGARIRLFNNTDRGGLTIQARAVTGADGVCNFEGLPPGAWAWIDPQSEKGEGNWTRVTLPAAGELRQEIKLPACRTLTGSVVDAATRHAIEGAAVGMNWTLGMSVRTRADGSYELPGWTGDGVDDVHVLAEGYSREAKKVGTADRLDFEMQRGYAVTGRVVGADGHAVAGAIVALIASAMSGREQRVSSGYATSDSEGRFRITSLTVGMRHALVAGAPGFARLRRDTPVEASAADVALGDVVLVAPHRVEGVVVGSDGTPQARVPVILSGPDGAGENWYGQSVHAFTDDLGRFRFDDAAPGAYTLKSRVEGGPETTGTVTVPSIGDVTDVKLVRETTRDVAVTVVDTAGVPVASAGIYVSSNAPSGSQISAAADAQGKARIRVPGGAKLTLSVFASGPRKFLQSPQRELSGGETEVTVVLEEGAPVTGRIVDPDGAPVATAWIEFRGPGDARAYAQSDADGRFATLVHRDGRSVLVFEGRVQRGNSMEDSGLSARVEDVAPGADVAVRCERVAKDRKLTVVVRSPKGEPVAGAHVSVNAQFGRNPDVVTDAAGRAAFENLIAREHFVSVWLNGPNDFVAPVPSKVVPDGQELRLDCRAATKITGVVVGADGLPLPYSSVSATRDGLYAGMAQVGADGRFALLLPSDETAPVRLAIDRDNDAKPDAVLDSVAPGTVGVKLVLKK